MEIMSTWAMRQRPGCVNRKGRSAVGQLLVCLALSICPSPDIALTVPVRLVNAVLADVIAHLFDFEQDESAIWVPTAVVLYKEVDGLGIATVGHEKAR